MIILGNRFQISYYDNLEWEVIFEVLQKKEMFLIDIYIYGFEDLQR